MEQPNYFRAFVCGLVATYMMSVAGHWVVAIGLPRADPARVMAVTMGAPYMSGLVAHFVNGIILAFLFARWGRLLPGGSAWAKGVSYGVLLTLAAQLVLAPLVAGRGFFFLRPGGFGALLTSLIAHLVFGLALAVGYGREGERGA